MAIYFIQRQSDKAIKIGYSHVVQDRLKLLKNENGNELNILCAIKGDMSDEAQLHKKFVAYRIEGEWFAPNSEILNYIDSIKENDSPELRSSHNGRIIFKLNDELETQFRNEIAKRLGMKKGNIQIAAEEAIKLWIKQST